MPNARQDIEDPCVVSSQASPLATHEMQAKVCSTCATPITLSNAAESVEANGAGALLCASCTRGTHGQDTPMNDATNTPTVEISTQAESMQSNKSTTGDDKGNIIKDNNTSKPSLKVVKVDFPGRSNADPITPTTPVQSSQVSARTISMRSPVAEQALSAALKAHIQRQALLDPFLPLTSLRVPSRGYDCLYPGALFEGMQTNKTKEHRVSVRIVDVNMDNSTLSGFLTIHDLTDQHPEITTFFDGQIIGHHYGFMTNEWGATEKVDNLHWSHFPPYHQIQNSELAKPKNTFKNPTSTIDRGFVFMRWKERFLVPDHRVKSINGASYAGFYYICVEFGSLMGGLHSEALNPYATDEMEEDEDDTVMSEDGWPTHDTGGRRMRGTRRNSSHTHSSMRAPSASALDDDKPPPTTGYAYGQSPYASSSSYAPSTSPVTGANRVMRATGAHRERRRRLSIYTAGSVPSHVHDHNHGHGHSHGHASTSYIPSGYGVGSPPFGSGDGSELASHVLHASRDLDLDAGASTSTEDREIALEEALELDPVEELRRLGRREDSVRGVDRSRSRSVRRRNEDEEGKEYLYGYGRRGGGWMGPARLTGYYNHSERDHCDLYQKLELHHVPERTRASFEFR